MWLHPAPLTHTRILFCQMIRQDIDGHRGWSGLKKSLEFVQPWANRGLMRANVEL